MRLAGSKEQDGLRRTSCCADGEATDDGHLRRFAAGGVAGGV